VRFNLSLVMENNASLFLELKNHYTEGVQQQNASVLQGFLKDERYLLFKEEQSAHYVDLRCMRAECFILFGHFDEAIRECRMALAKATKKAQWKVYMLWTKLHSLQVVYATSDSAAQAAAQAAIMLAEKAQKVLPKSPDRHYQHLTFAMIASFFQLFLGERDKALKAYSTCQFVPIPIPQYNDRSALDYLFRNYAKGLAVAIDLKNEALLRNLLKVISIDDQSLYGEKNLFKLFHSTLLTTMDTHPAFSTDFNRLFQWQKKLHSSMKELDFFLTSTSANMSEALDVFFRTFK